MTFVRLPRPVFICNCGNHAWTALTQGYVTLVSPEDARFIQERAWSARKGRRTFYAVSDGVRLHRAIMDASDDDQIDHKSGNGLDNRRENLREATNQQNAHNGPSHRDSTSKYKGVSWYAPYQKWRSSIYIDKKQKCLGYFEDEELAALLYDHAAIAHFGDFARLNFPPLAAFHAAVLPAECPSSS